VQRLLHRLFQSSILSPCDGTAYLIGKFKVRIKQANPDPELNEGKDIILTDFLPWKKIDCRGLKVKKDQWIGSPIVQKKGMMGHKPTTKRRVTLSSKFDMWHSNSSEHTIGSAALFSTDLRNTRRTKQSLPVRVPKQLEEEKNVDDGNETVLLQREQQSEKNNLEEDLRLQREEEAETLRKLFAAKEMLRMKELMRKLLQEVASEVASDEDQERFDRLSNEFAKAEIYVEQALDEEIARLRASLMCQLRKKETMAESLNEERSYFDELDSLLLTHRDEVAKHLSDNDSGLESIAELEAEVKEKIMEKEEYRQATLTDIELRTPHENRRRRTNLREKQKEQLDIFVKQQDEKIIGDPAIVKNFGIVLPEWEIIISWLRSNPDEQQQELLSFDFLISMRLDGELEQEISDMYIQLLVWFIQKLQMVGSLTTEQEAKLLVRFRFLMIQLTRKLTREKKLKFIEVARGLARRHKRQRNELEIKHYQERFQRSMKVEKEEGGWNGQRKN
jgi:hypothetical protein